jgi:23S rRNA (guanosine2251-2'-O)-methyltransferase
LSLEDFLAAPRPAQARRLLAADGITNPQNAGMLFRSAVAGGIDGILWPAAGNAALGPLAVKASAGTLFKTPLVRCRELASGLVQCQQQGFRVYTLTADAPRSIYEQGAVGDAIYVLGNESEGVSSEVQAIADESLHIPMYNGVESLNVAVTAALIAYLER